MDSTISVNCCHLGVALFFGFKTDMVPQPQRTFAYIVLGVAVAQQVLWEIWFDIDRIRRQRLAKGKMLSCTITSCMQEKSSSKMGSFCYHTDSNLDKQFQVLSKRIMYTVLSYSLYIFVCNSCK